MKEIVSDINDLIIGSVYIIKYNNDYYTYQILDDIQYFTNSIKFSGDNKYAIFNQYVIINTNQHTKLTF